MAAETRNAQSNPLKKRRANDFTFIFHPPQFTFSPLKQQICFRTGRILPQPPATPEILA
jgi:hypothetical protein